MICPEGCRVPRVGTVGRQGLSAPSRCPAPACGSRGDALMMFGVSGHRLAVPPSASRATAVGAAVSRGADSSQTAEDAPSVRTRARAAEKSVDRAVARGRRGALRGRGARVPTFTRSCSEQRVLENVDAASANGRNSVPARQEPGRGRGAAQREVVRRPFHAADKKPGPRTGHRPRRGCLARPCPATAPPPAPPWAPRCPRHEWADDGDLARHGDGHCSPAHAQRGPSVPARTTEAQAPQVLPRRGGLREGPGCRAGREVTRGGCAWRGPSDLTEGLANRS